MAIYVIRPSAIRPSEIWIPAWPGDDIRMLESLSAALPKSPCRSLPDCGMALVASVVGGVAGYGTGALMPLVLVPMVGAEPVVPILSISALFTNTSRAAAFWSFVDGRRALIVLAAAVPTCVLGAWGYTMLTGKGAALVIGAMLVASVPLRRLMRRRGLALSTADWRRPLSVGGRSPAAPSAPASSCFAVDGGRARRRRRGRDRCGRSPSASGSPSSPSSGLPAR